MISNAITPVQTSQRIHYMDALRGFALLGIFIINLPEGFVFFDNTVPHSGHFFSRFDSKMYFLQTMFIEGKFYSLFSLLFGWGIALQWQRLKDKGVTSVFLLRRRLSFMMMLGALHIMLVWTGDIILFYSMLGFILLWIRNWSDKKLLYGGMILILSPILLYYLKLKFAWVNWPATKLYETGIYLDGRLNNIYSQEDFRPAFLRDSYFNLLKLNISGFFFRYGDLFFVSRIPKVLGMFMIGFYLGRNDNYKRFLQNKKWLWLIFVAGLVVGIPFNYWHSVYSANPSDYHYLTMKGWYKTIFYALGVAPLALSYAAGAALFFQTSPGKAIATFLQPVGKMAFSNYVLQSFIGVAVFFGIGMGMMDKVGPVYTAVFAISVFILQSLVSRIWLSYFAYGPIEWLWRSLTYKKIQPVKRQLEAPAPELNLT